MVPRTPKHTQKSHPHTHWGALVPSRIIRPEIKKHSACQLPAAQWRSQQPTSAICVGVWEPLYPPYTHAHTMLSQTSAGAGRPRLCVGMSRQSEHKWTGGRAESRFLKMCQKVIVWCDQAAVNGGSRLSWKKRSEKAVFTITQRLHELTEVTWGRRVMSQSKRSFKKVIEVGKNKTDTCLKLSRINGVFHSSDRMWAANRNKVNERSRSWGSWEIYK